MNKAFISLGSNMGNPIQNLKKAVTLIEKRVGKIISSSLIYETTPWQMAPGTANFINQVILAETLLTPMELIENLLTIEKQIGRIREINISGYQSRIIDLDILFYNSLQLKTDKITIPHPLLHKRRFVLEPLTEIAPLFVHPVLKKNIQAILTECADNTVVEKTVSK